MKEFKSNAELPQHNQGIIEDFIEKIIPSNSPYFVILKEPTGNLHILTNIQNKKSKIQIEKEINKFMEDWKKQ